MNDYVIFTDASADVEESFVKEHDIRFVPMHYTLGKEDRISNGPEEIGVLKRFYDGQRKGDRTQTSQIAPQIYIDNFEPELREGRDAIYLSLSSGITKTFDSVQIAKAAMEEKYPESHIYPVDTLGAAGSMGIMVERAVQNRETGMDVKENVADLKVKARRTSSRIDSCYRHGAQREADYVPCTGRIASSVCKKTWREDSAKGNSAFVSCDSG